jgi:hypothetical protein
LNNGAKSLAMRNSGPLRFLEQLIQQSKIRTGGRIDGERVNFNSLQMHGVGASGE